MAPPPVPQVPAWHEAGAAGSVEDDEREIWAKATAERERVAAEDAFVEDAALTAYLEGVATALLPDASADEMPPLRVYVLRSHERQAGAMADGGVIVSVEFLAAMKDEAQLAGLLGHEIAHLLNRHTLIEERYEALSRSTVQRMELSRRNEEEADQLGLHLMQQAGYAPRAMIEMLGLISEEDQAARGPYPQFESHPFVRDRVRALQRQLDAAPVAAGRRDAMRYGAAIVGVLPLAAELQLEQGNLERAHASIERLLRLDPENGTGYYLRGEYERRTAREGRRAPSARAAYERAVELSPDDPIAIRTLAFICREEDEPERAQELFRRYLEVAPEAPDRALIERYLRDPR